MRPDHFYPHPGGFGFWHGGLLEMLWFGLPLLIGLGLLGLLLWLIGRTIIGRTRYPAHAVPIAGGGSVGVSAVEILRQRYARGEIDGDTFQVMLNQLHASGPATGPGVEGDDEGERWQSV